MSSESTTGMPPTSRLIITLTLIALFSGVTVVVAHQVTSETIAQNHREARERAVFTVLPGATERVNYRLEEDALEQLPDEALGEANAHAGYDDDGELVGVAFEASALGYQDVIRLLYGYSPERGCIIGYTVLESSETPGLGQRIANDPEFLANFDCLSVEMTEDRTALAHDIRVVEPGTADAPGEIDGITGATVSSEAVGRAINESANRMLPALYKFVDQLRDPERRAE